MVLCFNPSIMASGQLEVDHLLKHVSRSFYLTLRVLPYSIKRPIGIAYLLARAADTVADTELVEIPRRQEALKQLRSAIAEICAGRAAALPDFGDLAEAQETITGEGTSGERELLRRASEVLLVLRNLAAEDRIRIGKLLNTIVEGQQGDLTRFPPASGRISALNTEQELDGYMYAVAGCVGEFWTDMCLAHVFPAARLDEKWLQSNGVRFGKGLQLVNILRDIPKDLHRGRCYIPANRLADQRLNPGDLLNPSAMERFRPLYDKYLDQAERYLSSGCEYTTALPFRCLRVRLACAWPLLIGSSTLKALRTANVLDEAQRVKISRPETRRLMIRSVIFYPFPPAWNRLFDAV
jgi:farnesyl-diphosphate farnesyltransferase